MPVDQHYTRPQGFDAPANPTPLNNTTELSGSKEALIVSTEVSSTTTRTKASRGDNHG